MNFDRYGFRNTVEITYVWTLYETLLDEKVVKIVQLSQKRCLMVLYLNLALFRAFVYLLQQFYLHQTATIDIFIVNFNNSNDL